MSTTTRRQRQPATRAGTAGLALLLLSVAGHASLADPVERGRYLLHAAGCHACHTAPDDGAPLAGGRRLETPFGVFYSSNITPDPETGIGAWTDEDFVQALHEGIRPDGSHYYPVFPYTAYTGMTREDALAIKAYLFTLEPIRQTSPEHKLPWYLSWRAVVGPWKWLNFEPGRLAPTPSRDEQWNRGAYLTEALGHCGECHSPRTATGGLDRDRSYAGTADGPDGELVPNITPDPDTGIGRWDEDELFYLLKYGELPDGDYVGGSMAEVVDYSTSKLTDADLRAMIDYLQDLPPVRHDPGSEQPSS